jgi:Na+-translocating ferredoxin:NAD+ oxidoreductase RnfG subunit
VRLNSLGLRHDRLAYLAKSKGELTMVIIPATAQDGLNGEVDLLVAIDMFGRI